MTRGRFITFEGGEGSGKSTHVRMLTAALTVAGVTSVATREPGGTDSAEAIRSLLVEGEPGRWTPTTELLLHMAARQEHIARVVEPALARGDWVVCDRFVDSTIAYQGVGHGLGRDLVAGLHELVFSGFLPDLTLIMDVPVEQGLERAGGRDNAHRESRYERMELEFHKRLRNGFLEIAEDAPERCIVIDATAPIDAVAAAIVESVNQKFNINVVAVEKGS